MSFGACVCLSSLSIVCVSVCVCVVRNRIDHLKYSLFVIKPIESWKETVEVVQHEGRFRLQARSCQCPRRTYRMIPIGLVITIMMVAVVETLPEC